MGFNYVNIDLDKPRRLRYDFNAIADIEDQFGGVNIGFIINDQMGLSKLRTLLWAGLKWEEHGLTVQRTGTIIQKYIENGGSLEELGEKIVEAFKASGLMKMAEETESEDGEKN